AQVEVATHHIPHDDFILVFQRSILFPCTTAIGGPEQIALCQLLALFHIAEILLIGGLPAPQVMMGVIADAVTLVDNSLEDFRMAAYIIANAEKGSLYAKAF